MSECSGSCNGCEETCSSRQPSKEEFLVPANPYSNVKRMIGVVSGKGGVGKSLITSYLSVLLNRKGYHTAILDADITGPSIPKAFGVHKKVEAVEAGIIPAQSETGIKMISANLILETEETPVIWRGPIIAGTVKQFWSDVMWGEVDYMFVDMPPGTGDVPLTVFQSLPLDGIIIVTSPQDLVSMIVSKAVNMANAMDIPIIGMLENYSYIMCSDCGKRMSVFGESHVEKVAIDHGIRVLGKLPIDPVIAKAIDEEKIEQLQGDWLDNAAQILEVEYPPIEKESKEEKMEHTASSSKPVKIAVTNDGNDNIYEHFGTCERFAVYEIDQNGLLNRSELSTNGKGHSEIAGLLKENNITVVICGGIGGPAMEMMIDAGVSVIPGQSGDIKVAVAAYLDGSLIASKEATCDHHDHHDQEGESCSCGENCCH